MGKVGPAKTNWMRCCARRTLPTRASRTQRADKPDHLQNGGTIAEEYITGGFGAGGGDQYQADSTQTPPIS